LVGRKPLTASAESRPEGRTSKVAASQNGGFIILQYVRSLIC
jgi:hypothetical protein